MLGRFVSGWLSLGAYCCCPDFWPFARARSWSLERALSSCLVGRARVASLERAMASGSGPESCISWLERAVLGASGLGLFFARARGMSLERASGCRPEGLSFWLERGLLGSSENFQWLVARTTNASLERACFISADSSGFEHQFFTFFFFQTLDPRLSLSKLTLSLRFDLPRV